MANQKTYHDKQDQGQQLNDLLIQRKRNLIQMEADGFFDDDPAELEADQAAEQIVSGGGINAQNLGAANTQPQGKAEGEAINMENSISGSLAASKGGGQVLDDTTKEEMEGQMNTDLSDVRIHTDSNAQSMNKDINAKAFTHGQDIYFGEGNFDTQSTEGKNLLAHELAHTQQQGNGAKRKIQRQEDPATLEGFSKLKSPIFGQISAGTKIYHGPSTSKKVILTLESDILAEAVWEKASSWYFIVDMEGIEGYVTFDQFTKAPEKVENEPENREFVISLGNTNYIQAADVPAAFRLAREHGMTPNVGEIFWFTDGVEPPRPILYEIHIADPTDEMVDIVSSEMDLISPSKGGSGKVQAGGTIPKAKGTDKLSLKKALNILSARAKELWGDSEPTSDFSELPTEAWNVVAKSFEKDVNEMYNARSTSQLGMQGNKKLIDVPTEGDIELSNRQAKWSYANDIPMDRDQYSPYGIGGFVFAMTLRQKIAEEDLKSFFEETDAKTDYGSLEWYVTTVNARAKANEKKLTEAADFCIETVLNDHEEEVAEHYKPYVEEYQEIELKLRENLKDDVEDAGGWYQQQMMEKAIDEQLAQKREEINARAVEALQGTPLGITLKSEIEELYKILEKSIIGGNLSIADEYDDPVLNNLFKTSEENIKNASNYSEQDAALQKGWKDILSHLEKDPEKYSTVFIGQLKTEYFITHSATLLFDSEGKLTAYAVKEWADRSLKDINRSQEVLAPAFYKQINVDYSQRRLGHMDASRSAAYTDLVAESNYARIYLEKILSHPENDEGFWAGFTSKHTYEYIPFVHSVVEIDQMSTQKRSINKFALGAPMRPTEELLLQSYSAFQQIQAIKPTSRAYAVGQGVATALTFMGEFILTAPIGAGFGGAFASALTRSLVMRFGKKILEKMLVRVLIKGTGVLTGSFFQTIGNPLDIMKNIHSYGMPIVDLQVNEDGSYTILVGPSENGAAEAMWKGFITSYIEVFTERLGGVVTPFLGRAVKRFLPGAGRFTKFVKGLGQVNQVFKKVTGFHGIVAEYEEEVYAQLLDSMLKGEHLTLTDKEQQIRTFLIIAIIGGKMKAIQGSIAGFKILRTFTYSGQTIVLPEHIYLRFCELTGVKEIEDFKKEIEGMSDLTTDQIQLAKEIADALIKFEGESTTEQGTQEVDAAKLPQNNKDLSNFLISLYEARKNLLTKRIEGAANPEVTITLNWEGATEELTLYNDAQIKQWIYDAELAIANMEGYSVKEVKESAGIDDLISHNIELWKAWKEGWRPSEKGEVKARIQLKQIRLNLKEDLRSVFDQFRLPDESAVEFKNRIDLIEKQGRTIEEFLEQNRSNIENYRLSDQDQRALTEAELNRPDADQTQDPDQLKEQRTAYEQQLEKSKGLSKDYKEVEEAALDAEQRFNLIRQLLEPIFGKLATDEVLKDSKEKNNINFAEFYDKQKSKALAIIRNPKLSAEDRKKKFEKLVNRLKNRVTRRGLDLSAFDFAASLDKLNYFELDAFSKQLSMDETGTVFQEGEAKGGLQSWIQKVNEANKTLLFNGVKREFVLLYSQDINGSRDIFILSRPIWEMESPEGLDQKQVSGTEADAPYIVDIGSGLSSYGIDMMGAEDRGESILVSTEFAPGFVDPSLVRSDLTWKNAAPRTDENTVVVIGDPLMTLEMLLGQKSVKTLFINNVNAGYEPKDYEKLATQLLAVMAAGGKVEIQWDLSSERKEEQVSRKHIQGDLLFQALQKMNKDEGRTITYTVVEPVVYPYSVTPSKRKEIPADMDPQEQIEVSGKDVVLPDAKKGDMHRWIIKFD